MMKKLFAVGLLAVGLGSLSGCFSAAGSPAGYFLTFAQTGKTATSNPVGAKKGEACAMGILGLVVFGDASIATAAKNGSITKVSTVDVDTLNILHIFQKHCSEVTGD